MTSELIYHHTTTEGLIGIVSTGNIWATDIEFLNDHAEFKAGLEELKRTCAQCSDDAPPELQPAYQVIEELIKENLIRRRLYISSFTKSRDDLRQWMSYGRPNASYCIAFDREALAHGCGSASNGHSEQVYRLIDVDYSQAALKEHLRPDMLRSRIMKMSKDPSSDGAIFMPLFNDLMFGTCSIKNSAFKDEKETRLIFSTRQVDQTSEATMFRSAGGMVIPYIPVNIPTAAIKEIIIGPTVDQVLAERGVELLLSRHRITATITHTKNSLRQF